MIFFRKPVPTFRDHAVGAALPPECGKPPATARGFVVLKLSGTASVVVAAKAVVEAKADDVVVECNVVSRRKAGDWRRCKIRLLAEPHVEILHLRAPGRAERVFNAAARGPTRAGLLLRDRHACICVV